MADFEFNIRDLYRILRRRKWALILSPLAVGLLTYLLAPQPTPSYSAEALVKVSHVASNLQALLIESLSYYQGDNIETQSRIITSQKIKVRVAKKLAKSERYSRYAAIDYKLSDDDILANPRLVSVVENVDISAEQKGNSDIIGITSYADRGDLAVDTANATVEVFVDYNREEKNRQIVQALRFIQRRIRETQHELEQADGRMEEFKSRNMAHLALPSLDSDELAGKLDANRRAVANLSRAIDQLEQISSVDQYLSYSPFYVDIADNLISQLESQLLRFVTEMNSLRSQRRQLLQFQTDQAQTVAANSLKIEELQNQVEETIKSLSKRYQGIRDELSADGRALELQLQKLRSVPEIQREMVALQRAVELESEALAELQKRRQEAEIQKAGEVEEITAVEGALNARADLPPTRWSKVAVGLLLGLLMGGVFAFILESLDNSIGTIEDVESYLQIPVLGVVPHIERDVVKAVVDRSVGNLSGSDVEFMSTLCAHFAPTEPVSEACRTMRTHVDFHLKKEEWKTLMVTSSVLQEGKTTTSVNLATVFAQSGIRTLLIDADLRRPQVHRIFGLERDGGLTDVLLGQSPWGDAIHSVDDLILGKMGLANVHVTPGLEYLSILTAGRHVDNPSELLAGRRMARLLKEAGKGFDVVILDAAPMMPVADASVLAPKVDSVVMAYQIGRVSREVALRSKNRLQSLGVNVIGVVMNDIEAEISYFRGFQQYEYNYQYGPHDSASLRLLDRFRSRLGLGRRNGWGTRRPLVNGNGHGSEINESPQNGNLNGHVANGHRNGDESLDSNLPGLADLAEDYWTGNELPGTYAQDQQGRPPAATSSEVHDIMSLTIKKES